MAPISDALGLRLDRLREVIMDAERKLAAMPGAKLAMVTFEQSGSSSLKGAIFFRFIDDEPTIVYSDLAPDGEPTGEYPILDMKAIERIEYAEYIPALIAAAKGHEESQVQRIDATIDAIEHAVAVN